MAKNRFQAIVSDPKNRLSLVLGGAVVGVVALYLLLSSTGSTTDDSAKATRIASLNTKISNTPGLGQSSKEYQEIAYKDNQQRSEDAKKTGGSATPTLVSGQATGVNPLVQATQQTDQQRAQDAQRRYQELLERRRQEQLRAQLNNQQQQRATAARVQFQGQEKLMEKQAKALFSLWGAPARMTQIKTELKDSARPGSATTTAGGPGANTARPENIIYKAGDIIFAVIDTAINSDEPGPVMGRIVQGPLSGGKILGKFDPASGTEATKLRLTFTLLNMPNLPRSIPFDAVAIDPETARTAIATEVDHHYLLRYGSLLASSFLEGMSEAVLSSIESRSLSNTGGNIVFSSVETSSRDEIIAGLGKVGQKLGERADVFDRPPTITIASGSGVGLLITQDFNLNAAPIQNIDITSSASRRGAVSATQANQPPLVNPAAAPVQ